MTQYEADSILVLVELTPSGELAGSAAGLLGAAAQVGTPVALVVAAVGAGAAAADAAGALGAASVIVTETANRGILTVPQVDALVAAAEDVRPDAVLISN